jgi:hypothetical protein
MMVVIVGCSASRPIRVLHHEETALTASIGGPVVPQKVPTVAVPYLTVGAMHGVSDDVTIHGSVHALLAAFVVAGIDCGASARLTHERGLVPEITASAQVLMFTDFTSLQSSRIYPDLSVTASYEVATDWLAYVSVHNTFQTTSPRYLVSPSIGLQVPLSANVRMQAEFIWQAANVDTHAGVFEGQSSIGGHGSAGVFLGGVFTL